jgi:hypothetical protein
MFKQLLFATAFLSVSTSVEAQSLNQSLLIGNFSLEKIELSQQYDSNLVKIPLPVWTDFNMADLSEYLYINDYFNFKRSIYFRLGIDQSVEGNLSIDKNTLKINKGKLYTVDSFIIEKINATELILIERHKMRQVRRTFKRR